MRLKFDEQLRQLNNEMILMGNMIQKAIQDTIEAFFSQNIDKAKQIMKDDELVDQEQKKIENICFQLLIQQQPVARDLRTITAAMKMVTDMERIGDQAADIAELTIMMADSPYLLNVEHIKKMSAETVMMLMQAVQAYVERDMKKAQKVIEHDVIVDGEQSPLKNKFGATAEAILTEYKTTEDIANAPLEELVEFVAATGRGRFSDPNQVAELLQKAARDSYRLDKSLYEPITASIACSFNCIRAFEREKKALDKAIAQTVAGLNPTEYQILMSIPGIGPVYAAGILAEMGSVRCFKSNDALAKYSGIVWRDNQSGEFESDDTPMIKAGNRYLRYYLIQAAGSVATYCPEYAAFYEKKYAEVSKHQHKRALALTARKLIRLIFGLLDKNQLYSAAKG